MDKHGPAILIGNNLSTLRSDLGLTQEKLAEAAGISTSFYANLDGSNDIMLLYRTYLGDSVSFQLEKDAYSPEKYELDGITYYIMSNTNNYFVSWLCGNTECTIMGVPTYEELIRMINSLNPV